MNVIDKATKLAQKTRTAAANASDWAAAKVLAATAMATAAASSHAQAAPIDSLFDEIDISGIATKITALAVVIVGIALVIKGPSIVKRIISKI